MQTNETKGIFNATGANIYFELQCVNRKIKISLFF